MTADDAILLAQAHGAQHTPASWRGPQSLPGKPGSVTMTEAALLDFAQAVIAAHEAQRQAEPMTSMQALGFLLTHKPQAAQPSSSTAMTLAPREHSWHRQELRNDTLGALVRQAEQKPVAYCIPLHLVRSADTNFSFYKTKTYTVPLFAAPQPVAHVPLTPEQIDAVRLETGYAGGMPRFTLITRAIEQAHGITATQGATK